MERRWRWYGIVGFVTVLVSVMAPPLSVAGATGHLGPGPLRAQGINGTSEKSDDLCDSWPKGTATGSLHITTDPQGASVVGGGSSAPPAIAPGQTVEVAITWSSSDLSAWSLLGLSNCVSSNQVDQHSLDKVWQPLTPRKTGTTTVETNFVVPSTLDGAILCDSAWLWASSGKQLPFWSTPSSGKQPAWNEPPWSRLKLERSNSVCWLVAPPAQTPEARLPVTLGATALVIMGGSVVVNRRRSAHRPSKSHDAPSS